jgi:hypothetical protein
MCISDEDWMIACADHIASQVVLQKTERELATLRAENERLREALQGIVDLCDYGTRHHIIARKALK